MGLVLAAVHGLAPIDDGDRLFKSAVTKGITSLHYRYRLEPEQPRWIGAVEAALAQPLIEGLRIRGRTAEASFYAWTAPILQT